MPYDAGQQYRSQTSGQALIEGLAVNHLTEEGAMNTTLYVATINVPGYLPMDDDPPQFETTREAWEYLRDERERGLQDLDEEGEDETFTVLDALSKGYSKNGDQVGSVVGPTPGYDGDHDLGLAYSVSAVECECAYEPGDSGHELHCPVRS
jgi:hypothetical protein